MGKQPSLWIRWRKEVELVLCVLGLYTSYFFYGIVQERIFKTTYGGEKFQSPTYMVLVQCLVNTFVGKLLTILVPRTESSKAAPSRTPHYKFAICAFAVLSSMVLSNAAIQFISYPLQVLSKSSKMVPVLVIGRLILQRTYGWRTYLCVASVTTGVLLFSAANVQDDALRSDTLGTQVAKGLALVLLALVFDGVGGPYAERTCREHGTSSYELMFYQNMWSLPMLAVGLLLLGEASYAVRFSRFHPQLLVDLAVFSVSSACGQAFVFYILRNYSALTCTAATTTRKFFTVLVSIAYFRHALNAQQWAAVALVFGGIAWEAAVHLRRRERDGVHSSSDTGDAEGDLARQALPRSSEKTVSSAT